jgi:hypothetical protein
MVSLYSVKTFRWRSAQYPDVCRQEVGPIHFDASSFPLTWRPFHGIQWSQLFIIPSSLKYVRFEVFTSVTMKNAVFWDVAPCRYYVNRRFRGTYRLHLQGRIKNLWAMIQREQAAATWSRWFLARGFFLLPWRWRRYVPPKRRFIQYLHGATSQKTAFFIVVAWKPQILYTECIILQTTGTTANSNNRLLNRLYWMRLLSSSC